MLLYTLDLETNTNPREAGLDPIHPAARITSAAVYWGPLDPEGDEPEGALVFDDPIEHRLLLGLRDFFQSSWTPAGTIVTWNGATFDIPFIISRSSALEIPMWHFDARVSEKRKPKYKALNGHEGGYALKWDKHDHADIWTAYNDMAENAGIKAGLKPVSEFLGLSPVKVDATNMESLTVAERAAYNLSDVRCTFKLAQFMNGFYEEGVVPYQFEHYLDSKVFEEMEKSDAVE